MGETHGEAMEPESTNCEEERDQLITSLMDMAAVVTEDTEQDCD